MTAFFVRDCVRCGTKKVQHIVCGQTRLKDPFEWEVAGACSECRGASIYSFRAKSTATIPAQLAANIADSGNLAPGAIKIATRPFEISSFIPERVANLFREANECRQMGWHDAAGAMFRKTLDVATKHIYSTDERLQDKVPAQALRVRVKSMGEMNILDEGIVELADVAALDGNDAAHDIDPYSKDEAEALEDLTFDLLDRLFVRPAKMAAVKAKQIAAGVRSA